MREAVIVDAVRTPSGKGKPGGQLSGVHPTDLLATVLATLVSRNGVDAELIDDVIVGCVSQVGEQTMNIGRNAVLAAGLPQTVPATTIDRQCGSSQQAAHFAAQAVMAGVQDVVIACGVESMSRVPLGSAAGNSDPLGPQVGDRYAPGLVPQGISAELIAADLQLSRAELDGFAALSHLRAADAERSGAFEREILPIDVDGTTGEGVTVERDETIRAGTTPERLAALQPAFYDPGVATRFPQIAWHLTAGNSSPITDGASAVLIMDRSVAQRLGLRPRARFRGFAVVGDDPLRMLTAPIPATRQLLSRSGVSIEDIDAFEVNEAFAPIPLAWQRAVGADLDRVNIRGGAIALGHPLGASGTRLLTTLLHILEDHDLELGCQTMCEGGGMANATLIERC